MFTPSNSEIIVFTTLQVQLGEVARDLFLVYPYSMLEPIKEKLYSGLISDSVEQDANWSRRFERAIAGCPVRLTVQLGTSNTNVRDVLNLAPGDVLLLDQSPGDPLNGFIEGRLKFTGSAAVLKGSQAFRITGVLP